MTEPVQIATSLQRYFASNRNGWLCPFTEAVAGLTAAEAAWSPGLGVHSIWELVEHISFEHKCIIRRLQGDEVDPAALGHEYGWPPPGAPDDEVGWQAACAQAVERNEELAALVRGLSDQQVASASPSGKDPLWLHGLLAHSAYHVGQIVLLRRLRGAWNDLQWMP